MRTIIRPAAAKIGITQHIGWHTFRHTSSPILWGLVTAMASLVPMVGSALVWVPASIILIAAGHWGKALILLGWGTAVVAQIDVFVRPYVLSERVKVHTLLVFFALLGGMNQGEEGRVLRTAKP